MGNSWHGIGRRDVKSNNPEIALKLSPEWELGELYFDFKEDDVVKMVEHSWIKKNENN